jgi:hypothetical protein
MAPLDTLVADLRAIFALRLHAVILYGSHAVGPAPPGAVAHTLVTVTDIAMADLEACAARSARWRAEGLAVPLVMEAGELGRSLDAFPAEFSAIQAAYRVAYGADPFDGLSVDTADLRRACEVDARGHLLHLREGYIESGGEPAALARLVEASAPALRALLVNLARLDGMAGTAPSAYVTSRLDPVHGRTLASVLALVDSPIAATDAARDFPAYVTAAEALVAYVDRWSA